MPSETDFYKLARARIHDLRDASSDSGPMLDYYETVLCAQEETLAAFHPELGSLDSETCRLRIAEGVPILKPDDVRIDWPAFDRLCARICEIGNGRAGVSAHIGAWPTPSGDPGEWHGKLLRGLLGEASLLNEQAGAYNLNPDIFAFIASQAVSPFLQRYALELGANVTAASWLNGYCPICGGEALMAKLSKETGARVLHCHLCMMEWQFNRVECPFCNNKDQARLKFFSDDSNPAFRVDVCEQCKGYLKAVDERATDAPACLFVEYLATIHLDIVAEREGYQRSGATRTNA